MRCLLFNISYRQILLFLATGLFYYCLFHPYQGITIYDNSLMIPGVSPHLIYLGIEMVVISLFIVAVKDASTSVLRVLLLVGSYWLIMLVRDISVQDNNILILYLTQNFSVAVFLMAFICYKQTMRRFFFLLLISVYAVYALFILASFWDTLAISPFTYAQQPRLSFLFENPNHLGNVLAFATISCFSWAVFAERPVVRTSFWILMTVLQYGLVSTMSRGALLGYTVGMLYVLWHIAHRLPRLKVAWVIGIWLITLLVCFRITPIGMASAARISQSTPSSDNSMKHRILIWQATLEIIADNWKTGVELGRFGEVLDQHYKPAMVKHEKYGSAMNNYLTLAAEAGVPIAILYLVMICILLYTAMRNLPPLGSSAGTDIGILGGVIALLIFSLSTYTFGRIYANMILWLSFGYLLANIPSPTSAVKD